MSGLNPDLSKGVEPPNPSLLSLALLVLALALLILALLVLALALVLPLALLLASAESSPRSKLRNPTKLDSSAASSRLQNQETRCEEMAIVRGLWGPR